MTTQPNTGLQQAKGVIDGRDNEEIKKAAARQGGMPKPDYERIEDVPPTEYVRESIPQAAVPTYRGSHQESLVPDTCNLAERARLWINMATNFLCLERDYEPLDRLAFDVDPFRASLCGSGFLCTFPKFSQSLPLMRIMSGSTQSLEVDRRWAEIILHGIGPDGLFYVPLKNRPWDDGQYSWSIPPEATHYAYISSFGRLLGTITAYYRLTGDDVWSEIGRNMVDRVDALTVKVGDKAAFLKISYTPGDAPPSYATEAVESMIMQNQATDGESENNMALWFSWVVQGLAQYYHATGYEPAKRSAYGLANYMRTASFGTDGTWYGHHHAKTIQIIALAELAYVCQDAELGQFVQKTYEWSKSAEMGAIPALGYFPVMQDQRGAKGEPMEPCSVADMIGIAVKLTRMGLADYWEDVDQFVRNGLVEAQYTRADQITDFHSRMKEGRATPTWWCENPGTQSLPLRYNEFALSPENVVGWFGCGGWPNDIFHPAGQPSCCSGNCSRALYYAWENILQYDRGVLTVNLLLNRASAWADVESYIPYCGRVDIKMKTGSSLRVRMNDWIEQAAVRCASTGEAIPFTWSGRYLEVPSVEAGQVVSIEFPVSERTKVEKSQVLEYRVTYKGNEAVDISPHGQNWPSYRRDHYRSSQPRFINTTNFVCEDAIEW